MKQERWYINYSVVAFDLYFPEWVKKYGRYIIQTLLNDIWYIFLPVMKSYKNALVLCSCFFWYDWEKSKPNSIGLHTNAAKRIIILWSLFSSYLSESSIYLSPSQSIGTFIDNSTIQNTFQHTYLKEKRTLCLFWLNITIS